MNSIDQIVEYIWNDSEISRMDFSNKLINTVGTIVFTHGYPGARVFLYGKKDEPSKKLLHLIEKMEEKKIPLDIGTLILKRLNAIKYAKRR